MPTNYIVYKESDIDKAVAAGEPGDLVTYEADKPNKSEIHAIVAPLIPNGKNGKDQIGDSKLFLGESYVMSQYNKVVFHSNSSSPRKRKHSSLSHRSSSHRSSKRAKKNIPEMDAWKVGDREALTEFINDNHLKVGDVIPLFGDEQDDYGHYTVKADDVLSGGRKKTKKHRKSRGRKSRGRKTRGRKTKRRY